MFKRKARARCPCCNSIHKAKTEKELTKIILECHIKNLAKTIVRKATDR